MKREFLTKLLPDAPKEVIDQIMNENGKDIEAQKNTISTLTTERDGLKTQLDTARSEIQSYKDMDIDGIKAKASEWEEKYKADTQKLKDDLAAAEYGHTVKDAVASLKFSSEKEANLFVVRSFASSFFHVVSPHPAPEPVLPVIHILCYHICNEEKLIMEKSQD